MVGLSEEGPPKVDTEEVKHIVAKCHQFFSFITSPIYVYRRVVILNMRR